VALGYPNEALPKQLQFDEWVSFPLEHVFGFFSNPENLPRIMPAALQTKIESITLVSPPPSPEIAPSAGAAGVGSVIKTSLRLLPFLPVRVPWVARITEFEWNHYFADVQEKGPFKRWHHRHEFLTDTRNGVSGTLVRDVIEYEFGMGPLEALANKLFFERRIRETFAQRQKMLPALLR
jgi:ligand-binding SRPBCC domain-containing protein